MTIHNLMGPVDHVTALRILDGKVIQPIKNHLGQYFSFGLNNAALSRGGFRGWMTSKVEPHVMLKLHLYCNVRATPEGYIYPIDMGVRVDDENGEEDYDPTNLGREIPIKSQDINSFDDIVQLAIDQLKKNFQLRSTGALISSEIQSLQIEMKQYHSMAQKFKAVPDADFGGQRQFAEIQKRHKSSAKELMHHRKTLALYKKIGEEL